MLTALLASIGTIALPAASGIPGWVDYVIGGVDLRDMTDFVKSDPESGYYFAKGGE
ncbi:MAG: hypothetical protein IH851_01845 [Armatimonadetes bacterium]|nr:hypothetical protein [Armatimonadota bacterium]